MNAHVSIAFYGEYRPIHAEAETLEQAVTAMRKRVTGPPLETLESLWSNFQRQRKAGVSIESARSECFGISVSIRDYKRDRALDSLTKDLPASPCERGDG